MVRRLYRVTYIVESVVYASSKREAVELAADNSRSDVEHVPRSRMTAQVITGKWDIPRGWRMDCIPWGDGDPETIRKIVG